MSHTRKVLDTLILWVFSILFDGVVLALGRRQRDTRTPDEKRT